CLAVLFNYTLTLYIYTLSLHDALPICRTFMLPIALLPIAGLFLGLGSAFTNESLIANYGLENIMGPGTVMNGIFMKFVDVGDIRSEEHTSELQSRFDLVCRLLLEKKKK